MMMKKALLLTMLVLTWAVTLVSAPAMAQSLSGAPADSQYKYSTPMPPGVAAPDKVETRLGTLNFFDGFPDKATAEKLYDNLDFQRAVQAYLLAIPAVSQAANRSTRRSARWGQSTKRSLSSSSWWIHDPSSSPPTTTPSTVGHGWISARARWSLRVPPKVLGAINDMWYRWVVDLGITGPDKGKGGKYLILPPGYKGQVPKGYIVVKSPTFSIWIPWRSFLVNGDPKPGIELVKKFTKIYPLSSAGKPAPKLTYVDLSGKPFNTVAPADYSFWELLNQVVQEEPLVKTLGVARPDPARLLCVHRHPEGKTLCPGRAHEKNPDRGGRGG